MKKLFKLTLVLFLTGMLLGSVGYALGGRIPDTLLYRIADYVQIGRTHFIENPCTDYDVPNHAQDFVKNRIRGWND